jgi:outer membrane protein TolC
MSKKAVLSFALSFILLNTVRAQESMISDISYSYLDTLINTAKKNYPQVKIEEQQLAIAKANIGKADVGLLDAFNFSYFYRPADKDVVDPVDPYIFNGYQFGINVNLGTLLENPFTIKAAKVEYKVAQLNEQEYNLTIEADVKKRYFDYVEQTAILKLRTKSMADATDMAQQLKYKFEKGEASFADYNSASLVEAEQNQSVIVAESGVLEAKASLEEIVGEKLENIH